MQWKSRNEYASFTRCLRKKGFLGILGVSKNCGRSQLTPIIRCSTGWSLLRSKVTKWITFSPKRFPLHPNLERDDSWFQFISSYETFIYHVMLIYHVMFPAVHHITNVPGGPWAVSVPPGFAKLLRSIDPRGGTERDRRDWPAAQAKYQTQPVGASSALHGIESATAHSLLSIKMY